jgi:Short C-terminal domain/Phospholipase_D-nuclease N-terminal
MNTNVSARRWSWRGWAQETIYAACSFVELSRAGRVLDHVPDLRVRHLVLAPVHSANGCFRGSDLSGWGKAGWTIFVLFLPLIGVLTYLIVRGRSMHKRTAQQAAQREEAFRGYVREAAGLSASSADQLAKLADLRQRGVITSDEFEQEKSKVLASH